MAFKCLFDGSKSMIKPGPGRTDSIFSPLSVQTNFKLYTILCLTMKMLYTAFHKIIFFENLYIIVHNRALYFHRTYRRTRTVPYFDIIFETKYSKTFRQKFKANIFSDRVKLALSESYFIFIF